MNQHQQYLSVRFRAKNQSINFLSGHDFIVIFRVRITSILGGV